MTNELPGAPGGQHSAEDVQLVQAAPGTRVAG